VKIVVTQRAETHVPGAWTACPEDEPAVFRSGANPTEAVGALILLLGDRLGLEFAFKPFPERAKRRAAAMEAH
jgi:hypothetical protein